MQMEPSRGNRTVKSTRTRCFHGARDGDIGEDEERRTPATRGTSAAATLSIFRDIWSLCRSHSLWTLLAARSALGAHYERLRRLTTISNSEYSASECLDIFLTASYGM